MQYINTFLLDSRLGPTLSCLVAEKSKFPNKTFLTQQQSFLMNSEWGQGEDKKVGLSKEQAKLEKEDVEEVEDGR